MALCDGDTIIKGGRIFRVNIQPDTDHGAPWEEGDGHGIVSDWTQRDKAPGERILSQDGGRRRYYDIKATLEIAKRDGWGLGDEDKAKLAAALGRELTAKEITAEAVEQDFGFLHRWCHGQWHYVGVIVTDITDEDPGIDNDYGHALWGVKDDDSVYVQQVADELIDEILGEVAEADAAAQKEHDEAAWWAARDVITTTLPAQIERHRP